MPTANYLLFQKAIISIAHPSIQQAFIACYYILGNGSYPQEYATLMEKIDTHVID